MLRQMFIEHAADDFGDLPLDFAQWEVALSRGYSKLYQKLRDPYFDGKVITLKLIGDAIGLSKSRVEEGLGVLESYGFISIDTSEAVVRVRVDDVPSPPSDLEDTFAALGQTLETNDLSKAETVRGYWNQMHRKYLVIPYAETAVKKDEALCLKLVKTATVQEIKKIMRWFWLNRNREDPTSIGYFFTNFNDLRSDMAEYERRLI